MHTSNSFNDSSACVVLPSEGKIASGTGALLYRGALYPYAEKRGNNPRVGVRTGAMAILVGQTELRIDQDPEWIIEISETPIDSEATSGAAAMVENMAPEQAEAFGATSSLMANAVSQAVSPLHGDYRRACPSSPRSDEGRQGDHLSPDGRQRSRIDNREYGVGARLHRGSGRMWTVSMSEFLWDTFPQWRHAPACFALLKQTAIT